MTIETILNSVTGDRGKSLKDNEARWLIQFCIDYKPNTILDIGTGWGVTGRIFSLIASKVFSIDKGLSRYAREQIEKRGNIKNIEFIQNESIDVILPIKKYSADLAFIDAGHPTLHVISDFMKFSRYIKNGGVICFHDCDRKDVWQAIELIENQNPKLHNGYGLEHFHSVGITRAYYWIQHPNNTGFDINRVDPRKKYQ